MITDWCMSRNFPPAVVVAKPKVKKTAKVKGRSRLSENGAQVNPMAVSVDATITDRPATFASSSSQSSEGSEPGRTALATTEAIASSYKKTTFRLAFSSSGQSLDQSDLLGPAISSRRLLFVPQRTVHNRTRTSCESSRSASVWGREPLIKLDKLRRCEI